MLAYGVAAIFNISANIYFIEKYSYIGASFVNVVTEFLVTFLMFVIIYRYIKYIPEISTLLKAVLSASIMTLALWAFPSDGFFILLFIGIFIYFSSMYLIKGISKEDFSLFLKK